MKPTSKTSRRGLVAGRVRKAPKVRARRRRRLRPPPLSFRPPVLQGGKGWVGGDLSRAEIYGDDGR